MCCDGPCVSVKELWELMESLDKHAFSKLDKHAVAHIHPAYANGIRAALDEIENGFNLRAVMEEAGLLHIDWPRVTKDREADQ